MNREPPKPGEKWRHFKGGEYTVIAIAEDELDSSVVVYGKEIIALPLIARHTEQDELLLVSGHEKIGTMWVEDGEESGAWARPLDNFMGMAGDCYRFERID